MTRAKHKPLTTNWIVAGFCLASVFVAGPRLYAQTQPEIDSLIRQLGSDDEVARFKAVRALAEFGDARALPELIGALKDEDRGVRVRAIISLRSIGPDAVPALMDALRNEGIVGQSATAFLGDFANAALIEPLNEKRTGDVAERAPRRTTVALDDEHDTTAIPDLVKTDTALVEGGGLDGLFHKVYRSMIAFLFVLVFYLLWLAFLWLGILRWRPLWFLAVNQYLSTKPIDPLNTGRLKSTLQAIFVLAVPSAFATHANVRTAWAVRCRAGTTTFRKLHDSVRDAFAKDERCRKAWVERYCRGHWDLSDLPEAVRTEFQKHDDFVDAWVDRHIEYSRESFQELRTVQHHEVHIELPVTIDGKTVDLGPRAFRPLFSKPQPTRVLIEGDAGSGKTSLACQLARWAFERDANLRLADQPMLPVLIEEELDEQDENFPEGSLNFFEAIHGKLKELTGAVDPISKELLECLLTRKRILVVVDHFSEMSEQTRVQIQPEAIDFPAAALVVTSRLPGELEKTVKTTIRPVNLQGARVSDFMKQYPLRKCRYDLYANDQEYFEACVRLTRIVGQRKVTVLLAKMFADQLMADKGGFPENLAELMEQYVNKLHTERTSDEVIRATLKDTKLVAWHCLKESFRSGLAERNRILKEMGGDDPETRLAYLEHALRLITTEGTKRNHIRFAIDPVAEYLAGLHLIKLWGRNRKHWGLFLKRAERVPGDPEATHGFLLAIRDCCSNEQSELRVPDDLPEKLGELARRIQARERVPLLIAGLDSTEPKDRAMSAEALGGIGPEAMDGVPALVRRFDDEDIVVLRSVTKALGEIGPAAKDAAPALINALRHNDLNVRRNSERSLGRIQPPARECVLMLIKMLSDDTKKAGTMSTLQFPPLEVLRTLILLGPHAKEVPPALVALIEDKDSHSLLKLHAVFALGRIAPDALDRAAVLNGILGQWSLSGEERVIIELEALGQVDDPRFDAGNLSSNLVGISAGNFVIGAQKAHPSTSNYDHEAGDEGSPVHKVRLRAFRMGRYPVTVTEYQRFVNDDGYTKNKHWGAGKFGRWRQPNDWKDQLEHLNRPVVGVSWFEAAAYAAWAGSRLPTEAEWEHAARGTEARRYPWGDEEPNDSLLNHRFWIAHPTPVGIYPRGATPEGVLDLAGNVWDWCADWYAGYEAGDQVDPKGPANGTGRVVRGGSWESPGFLCRSAYRSMLRPDLRNPYVGFRVVSGAL